MAASRPSGGHGSPNSHTRSLDKVFEEAQYSGEINLSNRKLKDFPVISTKYDLTDTSSADLCKNRFTEIPAAICDFTSLEKLNCYHNVMRAIPEALVQLQALTHLNLSRNQLCNIPPSVCQLHSLEVLHANNNKLVSLPEEISKLEHLMDLDVSCNEISHLPTQIGELESLRSLNVRKNLLVELPVEIYKLALLKLDFSSNKISTIPCEYRKMDSLRELVFCNNPLVSPPAHLCTKGRIHIMKYLHTLAVKEDKRRGYMNDIEIKRGLRKSQTQLGPPEEARHIDSPNDRWKRHTFDSGYSTTDSSEKSRWSPSEDSTRMFQSLTQALENLTSDALHPAPSLQSINSDHEDANSLAIKAAETAREQRQSREVEVVRRVKPGQTAAPRHTQPVVQPGVPMETVQRDVPQVDTNKRLQGQADMKNRSPSDSARRVQGQRPLQGPPGREGSPQVPGQDPFKDYQPYESQTTLEDEFTIELQRQKADYEMKKKRAEQIRKAKEEAEADERRRAALRVQEEQKAILERQRQDGRRRGDSTSTAPSGSPAGSARQSPHFVSPGSPAVTRTHSLNEKKKPAATKPSPNGTTYKRSISDTTYSRMQQQRAPATKQTPTRGTRRTPGSTPSPNTTPTERGSTNHVSGGEDQRGGSPRKSHYEANKVRQRLEEERSRQQAQQKEAVKSYVNKHLNNSFTEGDNMMNDGQAFDSSSLPRYTGLSKKAQQVLEEMSGDISKLKPGFTMRRNMGHAMAELEQIESLRQNIESRLKVTLPDDLPSALKDGVVLCHLANNVRPRSVSSIHVPSPAVPKLSLAKCRRNVENFLEACRRIGVDQRELCGAACILEEKGILQVAKAVNALLSKSPTSKQSLV